MYPSQTTAYNAERGAMIAAANVQAKAKAGGKDDDDDDTADEDLECADAKVEELTVPGVIDRIEKLEQMVKDYQDGTYETLESILGVTQARESDRVSQENVRLVE
jgi:hypothetical protein